MFETITHGILLGLTITAPVGPTNIEVIRRGLKNGWQSATIFWAGASVALIIYLLLVVFGLSFLTQSKSFNLFMTFFGVLVLFYLAYSAFKDFFDKKEFDFSKDSDDKKDFISGILLTISNPAVLFMWTGIMGADLATSQGQGGLELSAGILIGVQIFFAGLILLIHNGRRFITKKNFKYISLGAGLVLLYFASSFGHKLLTQLL